MNMSFLAIIKRIVSEQGESVLTDVKRVGDYFADFAGDEPGALKIAFLKCLEYGFYAELKKAPAGSRAAVKGCLAQQLYNEEGLYLILCAEAVNLLEAAVFGETTSEASAVNEAVTPFDSAPAPEDLLKRNYEEKCGEAETLKEKLTKTKSGLTAAIVTGLIALAVSIGIGVRQYNEVDHELSYEYSQNYSLRSQLEDLQSRYDTLESQHEALQSSYDTLLKNWVIRVTSISVGNWNNGQWINRPGDRLKASEMRFLNPVITYNSRFNEEVTLYLKIIDSNGQLYNNSSFSPSGYSFLRTTTINRGNNMSWDLGGWGNTRQSIYSPGNHRIEVWYEGICIGAATVTLH
jgi:hypothetical protein